MKIAHLKSRLHWWYCTQVVSRYWRAKAWLLWLPHRKLRAELHEEFSSWGTPMNTLRAISKRLSDTDVRLKHAWAEWEKCEKLARHAELMLAADRIDQGTRKLITDAFGVKLDENRN